MIATLNLIGGVVSIALSLYLLKIGKAQNGETRPFLKNGFVSAMYLMLLLTLFFGGGAWAIAAVSRMF